MPERMVALRSHAMSVEVEVSSSPSIGIRICMASARLNPVGRATPVLSQWEQSPDRLAVSAEVTRAAGAMRPWREEDWNQFSVGCRYVARIVNGLGIMNGEQRKAVTVCSGLLAPWTQLWPELRTIS
jgi:hypothetical protein